ncbi:hypothetical protein ACQPT2_11230 [Erwinia amylovora]
MKTVIISDSENNLRTIPAEYLDNACGIMGFFSSGENCPFLREDYPDLHAAVADSDRLVIAVSEDQWDRLVLGLEGMLTRIKEETLIVSFTPLSAEKAKVYRQFLTSKNLIFTQK